MLQPGDSQPASPVAGLKMRGCRRLATSRQSSWESGEETDSTCTTTASRRGSDSDSGVNLSEAEARIPPSVTPGTTRYHNALALLLDWFVLTAG